jgi:hypothetical protein
MAELFQMASSSLFKYTYMKANLFVCFITNHAFNTSVCGSLDIFSLRIGQLHAPAALHSAKEPAIPIRYKCRWARVRS